jgi:hypothetical protein
MDFLLWLLCSPNPTSAQQKPQLPTSVTATGSLVHFKNTHKPPAAGNATNCLSCPLESECQYSARKIYYERGLRAGLGGWPVNIVLPDIEEYLGQEGLKGTEKRLMEVLSEDYDASATSKRDIESRSWYGRCVYEADNDVCDNQTVTISWDDDPNPQPYSNEIVVKGTGRGAKTATFHMTAFSEAISLRKTHIYGTKGEIEANSTTITVRDFITGKSKVHRPPIAGGAHGGGDDGLARQFILAIDMVKNHGMTVEEAQGAHVGCTAEDIIRSHALVFAAEEARTSKKVVSWEQWWEENIASHLPSLP